MRRSLITCCCFLACTAPPESSGTPGAAPAPSSIATIEVPPPPPAPEIPEARTAFYARAFPAAARFVARPIPKEMLLSADKGNDSYVLALEADGELLGYLRDFAGPIIPGRNNPGPIALLFAFTTDLRLHALLPSEPLKKGEGTSFSAAELQQLLAIAQKPPAALAEFPQINGVVDGTTEATRDALRGAVVPGAAYTTHRVVGLVASSRELIGKAPAAWDRKRLQQVVSSPASDSVLAHALAQLLTTLETDTARTAVYQMMSHSYALGLRAGAAADSSVEALMLNPPLGAEANTEIARGCYDLARRNLRPALIDKCMARVTSPSSQPGDPASVARLVGTHQFARGNSRAALAPLRRAIETYDHLRDPELHLRWVLAAMAENKGKGSKSACTTAKKLFRDHPLLPKVDDGLRACPGDLVELKENMRAEQKKSLLASRRTGNEPAPKLSLEGEGFQTVEINPAAANTITVLVFFSTWCPHCAAELPRINDFTEIVEERSDLRGRVRVVGIRTAVEKERIPYDQFISRLKPRFPIYADATFSLVFGQFARTQGLRPELPTLAVVDSHGVVRFLLASGDHRDTARELTWAVEALLP